MNEPKLLDFAIFDVDDAASWYEEQEPGVGERFRAEVRMAFHRINANADSFPKVNENVHRYVMQRFPFLIYYVVSNNEVTILRVIHSSREPDEWKRGGH